MRNFADRLIEEVKNKGNPCVVGLDFHQRLLPDFVSNELQRAPSEAEFVGVLTDFFVRIVDVIAPLVPAVKPQCSLLEPFLSAGSMILKNIFDYSKRKGLLVIADAKRGDIASSAAGYAQTFLTNTAVGPIQCGFGADAVTVNASMGRDTLIPFIECCKANGAGIFVLVKTSNSGSAETQDVPLARGGQIADIYATMVDGIGADIIGEAGYSAVGGIVGATFPKDAKRLRSLMPKAIILVPGYGTQGGTAEDVVWNFNEDGLGAVVNASRTITYSYGSTDVSAPRYFETVRDNAQMMVDDLRSALSKSRLSA